MCYQWTVGLVQALSRSWFSDVNCIRMRLVLSPFWELWEFFLLFFFFFWYHTVCWKIHNNNGAEKSEKKSFSASSDDFYWFSASWNRSRGSEVKFFEFFLFRLLILHYPHCHHYRVESQVKFFAHIGEQRELLGTGKKDKISPQRAKHESTSQLSPHCVFLCHC